MTQCPQCGHHTLEVKENPVTLEKSAKCSTCAWSGPPCFARHHDPTDPKCAGGADPTYWRAETHVRPRCSHFTACAKATHQGELVQMNMRPRQDVQVKTGIRMPPQAGVRHPTTAARPAAPPAQTALVAPPPPQPQQAVVQQPLQQQVQQGYPVQQGYAPPPYQVQTPHPGAPMAWVNPQIAAQPAMVPQNYPQPGAQVAAYLTVPEPAGQSVVGIMLNSALRAAMKGAFHTMANLMDHIPWGSPPPPPAQPPPTNNT